MAGKDNIIGKGFDARPEDINKGGRPKGSKNRSTLVRELLEARLDENHTYAQAMTKAVMEKALGGDTTAWEKLFDSAFGKVTDKQELTNPDGSLVPQTLTVKVVNKNEVD
jgi:hypothetical protein